LGFISIVTFLSKFMGVDKLLRMD